MMEPPPPPAHHFDPVESNMYYMSGALDDDLNSPTQYEERRPTVKQRIPEMSLLDDDLQDARERSNGGPALSQDYLYYRFVKKGDDWSLANKYPILAPVEQIEKQATKIQRDGTPLEQLKRMSQLRRERITEAVQEANDLESGDAHWEVVYIKPRKELKRNRTVHVPEMDVILARNRRGTARTKPAAREPAKIINEGKAKPSKGKQYADGSYGRSRKDSGLAILADRISNLPVFDIDGMPRDEHGPIHFNDTNLPPQIPRDKPLGAKPEPKKEDKKAKHDKYQKRSKSRDKSQSHGDGIFAVGDDGDLGRAMGSLPDDMMFGELPPGQRGRRGKSPHEHPQVVVDGNTTRSYSRRRAAHTDARAQSREKSRSRRGSVHFPDQRAPQYFDADSSSSEVSESSHYGFDYEGSSNTSIGSPGGVPRRGSLVNLQPRPDTVYKKHHRGPTRSLSYVESPYHGEQPVITPARSYRSSFVTYGPGRPAEGARYASERPARPLRYATTPLLEERQVVYRDPPHTPGLRSQDVVAVHRPGNVTLTRLVPVESSLPILHYPEDEVFHDPYYREEIDPVSSRLEDYQRDRMREPFFRHQSGELSDRDRDEEIRIRDDEIRRLRGLREQRYYNGDRDRRERRRSYYDAPAGHYYYYVD
ncbi:hypothetical protein ABEF95_010623 [Exophiala dermatitidis]